MKMATLERQVVVLDRVRLLHHFYEKGEAVPNELKDEIIDWLNPYIKDLPIIQ